MSRKAVFVTGGAGFIGSSLVRNIIKNTDLDVVNLDLLTYAGNMENLAEISDNGRHTFIHGSICDKEVVNHILDKYSPVGVFNLAAESHVDRSIDSPSDFINTNIIGTFNLLECSLNHWRKSGKNPIFKFLHISTDEVYGSLGDKDLFTEETRYDPSSPYSASKASSDHLVRAWNRTFGLPTIVTNCSNNYGPYHYPEKLIPLIITNALAGKPLPLYGDGLQIRDWLYVEDHANALIKVFSQGVVGETYNIGGDSERTNLEVVNLICKILDELSPMSTPRKNLIEFVKDRPGHDRRYAIDCKKIKNNLNWTQSESFETGLFKTVKWNLENGPWIKSALERGASTIRLGTIK